MAARSNVTWYDIDLSTLPPATLKRIKAMEAEKAAVCNEIAKIVEKKVDHDEEVIAKVIQGRFGWAFAWIDPSAARSKVDLS